MAHRMLGWSEDDILDVTGHLNQHFYGFTPTSNSLSQWSPAAAEGRVGLGA